MNEQAMTDYFNTIWLSRVNGIFYKEQRAFFDPDNGTFSVNGNVIVNVNEIKLFVSANYYLLVETNNSSFIFDFA